MKNISGLSLFGCKLMAMTLVWGGLGITPTLAIDEDTQEIISHGKFAFSDGGSRILLQFSGGGVLKMSEGGDTYRGSYRATGDQICIKMPDFFDDNKEHCAEAGWEDDAYYWGDYDLMER